MVSIEGSEMKMVRKREYKLERRWMNWSSCRMGSYKSLFISFFFGGNPPNKFHINCFTISNKIKKMGACIMHL